MVGSCSTPPFASVAYAFARSSGLTAFTPSTIEGTGLSFDWIPIRFASSAIGLGPRSRVRRAKTVLSERSVACVSGIRPEYVFSNVWTCQLFGPTNGADRYWVAYGLIFRCTACVRIGRASCRERVVEGG